jgi:hypothetical protein
MKKQKPSLNNRFFPYYVTRKVIRNNKNIVSYTSFIGFLKKKKQLPGNHSKLPYISILRQKSSGTLQISCVVAIVIK